MFAISFDMTVSSLEEHYGMPYNRAYYEIKEILKKNGFEWIQGSTNRFVTYVPIRWKIGLILHRL